MRRKVARYVHDIVVNGMIVFGEVHFLRRSCAGGLSGGVSASGRNVLRGTFFRLVDSFFKGLGDILEASRLGIWGCCC